MVLGDTAGATCVRISSLDVVRAATAAARCLHNASDLDVRLYYTAVQNVVYGCGNVPYTIGESSDTPLIHFAQHVQQSVNMSI